MSDTYDIEQILLIANDAEKTAYKIFNERISKNTWPIYFKTKFGKYLREGIKVIFYIAGQDEKAQSFIASAKIKTIIENEIMEFDPNNKFSRVICNIKFEDINLFKQGVKIQNHLNNLSFIKTKDKRYFGLYLQGGVSRIDKQSFDYIIKHSIQNFQLIQE